MRLGTKGVMPTESGALLKPEPLLVTCDAYTLVGLFLSRCGYAGQEKARP